MARRSTRRIATNYYGLGKWGMSGMLREASIGSATYGDFQKLGSLHNGDHNLWGSILGPLCLETPI